MFLKAEQHCPLQVSFGLAEKSRDPAGDAGPEWAVFPAGARYAQVFFLTKHSHKSKLMEYGALGGWDFFFTTSCVSLVSSVMEFILS